MLRDRRRAVRPENLKYMKLLLCGLRLIGAYPKNANTESKYVKLFRCSTLFVEVLCFISQLKYLKSNIGHLSLYILGHTYITEFMNVVACCRLLLPYLKNYHRVVTHFITVIHLSNHTVKCDYDIKTHTLVHKIANIFTIYVCTTTILGIILFNLMPLYDNVASGAFSSHPYSNFTYHAIYHGLPFDYVTNFKGYIAVFIYNLYICCICCSCFCSFDLLLCLMVFHVWGHMKILINNLNNFPRPGLADNAGSHPQVNLFSEEEMADVSNRIRENIDYHNLIIEFVSMMSNTFGWVLLKYYVFHQVTGCFLLYQCSKMDLKTIVNYGPLTISLFYLLIQISVVFELLGSISEKLPDAVYNLPWECMPAKHRKLVIIFLSQSQRPLNVKAMNMVDVGVKTMATIFKTSFSYFIMLRTITADENLL